MTPDLNATEAAEVLRMPRQSLLRLAKSGSIGHYRVGRSYRFTPADLEEYRQRNHVAPTHYMGRIGRRKRSA